MTDKLNWGGKRKGSGWRNRPENPDPTVTVSCRISKSVRDRYQIDSRWLQDAIAQKIKTLPNP